MERLFTVYKIVAPSGEGYIGYTSMCTEERWRHHVWRAVHEKIEHPFYRAIREFSPESFTLFDLDKANGLKEAQELERRYIRSSPPELLFNLSPGGIEDASFGGKVFWQRLNQDPSARKRYLEKLSVTKKRNDWTDYEQLHQLSKKWREENPRKAYKIAHRASRVAKKKALMKSDKNNVAEIYERSLKEKLMWKHKRSAVTRINAINLWESRTEEEKAEVGRKISASQKETWKKKAILPDFNPDEWPYAKATVLRKIRLGLNRDQIVLDALEVVTNRGSHWREVKEKLLRMGVKL
ncbi:MAG: hypothetical protein SCK57_10395 [Bacillota bacterium]|nr:hypothetical protein [Bacillota bacterium]MDW7678059.1 hypothetical protein [Bacillota bacterium]